VQFGVLGPLRVVASEAAEPVVVSAAQPRVLLAVLLWRANQPVAVDELAELVWDGTPPPGATHTVRGLVMRLRRAVGQPVAARIVTRAPGYAIEVSGEELDTSRFEALGREAGQAAYAGRWAEAGQAAAAALGLWRGTPLADVACQVLRDRWVPSLEQLRVQALEWRIEADLRQGRHAQLIPELRDVAGRHPLREQFHAQLMAALAGTGRTAEALAAYSNARQVLVSELGIEPGPGLRHLHARILAGEATVVGPLPGPRASDGLRQAEADRVVPRQLPAVPRSFTGRRAELGAIGDLAEQAGQAAGAGGTVVISAIDGMAGIGKTALAVHAAHQLSAQFGDGQLFIDLHGYTRGSAPRPAGEALDYFLRALGVAPQQVPQDTDERAALFRQRLAGTRTLIVLDNAASEAQVRPLLPGSAGCLLLITSRRRLRGLDDAHVLALDVLPPADAVALVRTVAGPDRIRADDPALTEVADVCGRLPLALRIAAALLPHRPAWTLQHLAGLLGDQRQRISALSDGDRDLGAALDLSYQALPGDRQQMLRYLGLVPGPDTDAWAAAALTGTDPATATRTLEDLVDHNLLLQHVAGRYRMHDLIRLHAQALAARDPAGDRDAAVGRLLDYYQHTAGRADALIARYPRPGPAGLAPAHAPALPDGDCAWAWLRAERANLLAAVQDAIGQAGHERVIALTSGLVTLLRTDGPWNQALALLTAAEAAAGSLGDQRGRAEALARVGDMRALTGDSPGAVRHLERALGLYQDAGDRLGQANALIRLAETRATMSDFPGATRCLRQALRLYRDLGERRGQASALTGLGDVRRLTCDLRGAADDLQEALQLFCDVGIPPDRAGALTRLGDVRRLTGDFPGAMRDLREALVLFRDMGDRQGQANTLNVLGQVRQGTGDSPGAAGDLQEALQLCQDLGDPLGQANALGHLGHLRLSDGDYPGAAEYLEAAIDLFRRIGSRSSEAWALNRYAALAAATGDRPRARDLYHQALRLARQAHTLDTEALALEGIGECHLHLGDAQAGIAHLSQALDIFQRQAMTPDADRVRTRLAQP
jgi:DNA-binding SARP family transcriptional activator